MCLNLLNTLLARRFLNSQFKVTKKILIKNVDIKNTGRPRKKAVNSTPAHTSCSSETSADDYSNDSVGDESSSQTSHLKSDISAESIASNNSSDTTICYANNTCIADYAVEPSGNSSVSAGGDPWPRISFRDIFHFNPGNQLLPTCRQPTGYTADCVEFYVDDCCILNRHYKVTICLLCLAIFYRFI